MNITIIKSEEPLNSVGVCGEKILETHNIEETGLYDLGLFYPEDNSYRIICPDVKKFNTIPVLNCIWNSEDVFFASVKQNENDMFSVILYVYSGETGEYESLLEIPFDRQILNEKVTVRFFVISPDYVIVQTEKKIDDNTGDLMGNIEFSLSLCNIATGENVEISDLNLINNGINTIVPVSENYIMLKTGFSAYNDPRINCDNENEALIESVYYSTLSMFIGSLKRENTTVGYKMLGTAYYKNYIVDPQVKDDYIFFTIFDREKNVSETVFYNCVTDETIRCVNEDASQED